MTDPEQIKLFSLLIRGLVVRMSTADLDALLLVDEDLLIRSKCAFPKADKPWEVWVERGDSEMFMARAVEQLAYESSTLEFKSH